MELEEISSKNNVLLKRKELVFKVAAEQATPKNNEIIDRICSKYEVKDKGLVVLQSIKTGYGTRDCRITARIYEKKEDVGKTESIPKPKVEKQPGEAAPAAAPAAKK